MLVVHEIYTSIQGESTHVGRPCVFVRLTACDLRCSWCDTPYAFTGGKKMPVDEVMGLIAAEKCRLIELTGGEPLLQPDAILLMERLVADGFEVLLETGGHRPLDDVPDEVTSIVDVKCPASGEAAKMHWPNLDLLSAKDEVKFVIVDRHDFEYALDVARRYQLDERVAAVHFSPAFGLIEPAILAEWLIEARLPARLQLQTHKYIWDPETRGV